MKYLLIIKNIFQDYLTGPYEECWVASLYRQNDMGEKIGGPVYESAKPTQARAIGSCLGGYDDLDMASVDVEGDGVLQFRRLRSGERVSYENLPLQDAMALSAALDEWEQLAANHRYHF